MKKIIRLTENDLIKLVNRVINEQNTQYGSFGNNPYNPLQIQLNTNSKFETDANVEEDMLMTFIVLGFIVKENKVGMVIKEKDFLTATESLKIVYDFSGPIFDYNTKKQIYTDSYFGYVNRNNFMKIASQNNIPVNK